MAVSVKQLMEAANAAVPRITPAQAQQMIAAGNTLVVDVRTVHSTHAALRDGRAPAGLSPAHPAAGRHGRDAGRLAGRVRRRAARGERSAPLGKLCAGAHGRLLSGRRHVRPGTVPRAWKGRHALWERYRVARLQRASLRRRRSARSGACHRARVCLSKLGDRHRIEHSQRGPVQRFPRPHAFYWPKTHSTSAVCTAGPAPAAVG